jgi:hypothetical protein
MAHQTRSLKAYDLSIGQKVLHATTYILCFHIIYFTEAGKRRKARETIGDFAGFRSDSKQNRRAQNIEPRIRFRLPNPTN